MNLYLIILKDGEKYYVTADSCDKAIEKLENYFASRFVVKQDWETIKILAIDLFDTNVGVYE